MIFIVCFFDFVNQESVKILKIKAYIIVVKKQTNLQLTTLFVNHCLHNTVFAIATLYQSVATAVITANWFGAM